MKNKQEQQSPNLKDKNQSQKQKLENNLNDGFQNTNQLQSFQQQHQSQPQEYQLSSDEENIDDTSSWDINKYKTQIAAQQQASYQQTKCKTKKKVNKKEKKQKLNPPDTSNRNKLYFCLAFLIACVIVGFLGYHIYRLKQKNASTVQNNKKQSIKIQNLKPINSTQTNITNKKQSEIDLASKKQNKIQKQKSNELSQKINTTNKVLPIENSQTQKKEDKIIIQTKQQSKEIQASQLKNKDENKDKEEQSIKPLNNFCMIMNKKTINEGGGESYFKLMVKQLLTFQKQKQMERQKLKEEEQKLKLQLKKISDKEKQQQKQRQKQVLEKKNIRQKNINQWDLKLIAFQSQNLIQKYQKLIQQFKENSFEIIELFKQKIQVKKNENLKQYQKSLDILNKIAYKKSTIQFQVLKTFHNKGENIYNAIHNHCQNDDIVIMLNQGDQLVNYEALKTVNEHFSDKSTFMAASHLIDHQENVQKPQNSITYYRRVNLYADKRTQQQMKTPIQIIRFTRFFRVSYYKRVFHTKLMNYKLQFLDSSLSFLLPLSQNFQFKKNEPSHINKFFPIPSKFNIIQKTIIKQNQPFKSLITEKQLEEIRQIQDKVDLQNVNQVYLTKSLGYKLNLTNFHLQTKRKIPKKIHQVQIGKRPITQLQKYLRSKVKQHMEDYEYKLWTEEDLTRQNFPCTYDYIQKLFQIDKTFQFSRISMVVDLMKFEIIYQHGGIYLDKNVQILKSLDHLTNFRLFSGRQDFPGTNYVSVGVYGAQQNSPLLAKILTEQSLRSINLHSKSPNADSGPGYFGKSIQLEDYYTGDLFVLDSQNVYPYQKWKRQEKIKNCACAVQSRQLQQYWPRHMKEANIKFQFIQQKGFKIIKNCPFYKYSYSLDYFMFGGTWQKRRPTPNNNIPKNNPKK